MFLHAPSSRTQTAGASHIDNFYWSKLQTKVPALKVPSNYVTLLKYINVFSVAGLISVIQVVIFFCQSSCVVWRVRADVELLKGLLVCLSLCFLIWFWFFTLVSSAGYSWTDSVLFSFASAVFWCSIFQSVLSKMQ